MGIARILLRPRASDVLTAYLKQSNEPPWTSYFVKYKDVRNDQHGWTSFNWTLDTGTNYQILRTGCFPYIKYHCSRAPYEDLTLQDGFFRFLKVMNLCVPLLFYGLAAVTMITHREEVYLPGGNKVIIYFLYPEDKGSKY